MNALLRLLLSASLMALARLVLDVGWWIFDLSERVHKTIPGQAERDRVAAERLDSVNLTGR